MISCRASYIGRNSNGDAFMLPDGLKKLANDSEAEMYRLIAPLTAEETEAVAQLVEMAAMKAWVERERAKGRAESELTWG